MDVLAVQVVAGAAELVSVVESLGVLNVLVAAEGVEGHGVGAVHTGPVEGVLFGGTRLAGSRL